MQIDLDLSDRYLDLQSSGVDLAIRLSNDAPSGWMIVDVGAVPVRLCASPAYIAKHGVPVTPDQLATHRLLAAKTYTARTKWSFRWKGRLQHLEIAPFFVVSDFTALAALVRAGVGISALPAYLSDDDIASGQLVNVLSQDLVANLSVFALRPSHLLRVARVRVIVEALQKRLGRSGRRMG